MKKIIYIIFVLCMVGCEDFFELEINDRFTNDNFWQNETHALFGINGVYNVLAQNNGDDDVDLIGLDCLCDNAINDTGDNSVVPISLGTHTASTVNMMPRIYTKNYRGIGRANTVISRVSGIDMDAELKNRIIAEARFLRAYFYSELVKYFGSVPLIIDEPDSETQSELPRSPRGDIVSQIVKDLDEVKAVLPSSYTGEDLGRATRGAAVALKVRVYLYEGQWAEAASAAEEVMSMGYSLFPDYRGLFMLTNENNQEVIFDVQFAGNLKNSFDVALFQFDYCAPLPNLVDTYDMANGLPITDPASGYDPDDPYTNRDPRLTQTIAVPGSMLNGSIVDESKYFKTGYGYKKYQSYSDSVAITTLGGGESELNWIILRYADILLMYAEAENEVTGPSAKVFDALDEVRARVDMPPVNRTMDQASLRNFIRKERRMEFAGEGLRYADIRRWDIGVEVMDGDLLLKYDENGDPIYQNRKFESPKHNLWPIPQQEVDINLSLLPQNSGW